jgi:tRNA G18 (ribose-2'-O)-methylase SpoU
VDRHNAAAIFRTAEAFGVQEVWEVMSPMIKVRYHGTTQTNNTMSNTDSGAGIGKGAEKWLTIRKFADTAACIAELRRLGCEIWATDLGRGAQCIHPLAGIAADSSTATTTTSSSTNTPADADDQPQLLQMPPAGKRLAVVMGRELDGVSAQMLEEADRRIYLPMVGFTESFNLSYGARFPTEIYTRGLLA